MARLALLAFGMLLTCAAWLWWHLDPATIAPAMAAAESSYTAAEPSSPLVAKGRRVPSAEPPSAAAGHASTSLASPERRAVVKNAKRYVIHGVVTRGGVGQPGREVLCSGGRGQKPATAVTGRDGVFAFEVDPGEYELYTPHTLGTTRQQAAYKRFPPSGRDRLAAAICSCVIESEDVDVTLQLSQNSLTVIVRNAKTFESIHWATATWQPPVPEQDELRIPADQGGRVRFSDVRPGKGSVVVSARAFVGAMLVQPSG